jgi:hypothetical protein
MALWGAHPTSEEEKGMARVMYLQCVGSGKSICGLIGDSSMNSAGMG